MNSDYNSVTEQAGIYAGSRGFDISVAGNTDLKGAVIASEAGYEDNILNTGTLSFDDIQNKTEYSTSGRGVNIQKTFGNKEGMTDEQKAWEGVTPGTGIGTKDEDESTTKSAIAEARINIMKPENQKQDITKLDRNTTKTLNKLGKIFDKEKIEEKQELAGLFQEMWHTTVGDLMAKSHVITDDQRKALNILGGAIAAELGGADFKAGLVGGATTELLQSVFSQIKDPSLRKVAVAVTAAMAAKGTGQEAGTAANVGVAIQQFNHDTHEWAKQIVQVMHPELEEGSEEYNKQVDEEENKLNHYMDNKILGMVDTFVDLDNLATSNQDFSYSIPSANVSDFVEYFSQGKIKIPVDVNVGSILMTDSQGGVYLGLTGSVGKEKGIKFFGYEQGAGFVDIHKNSGQTYSDQLKDILSGWSGTISLGNLMSGSFGVSFGNGTTYSQAGIKPVVGANGSISYVIYLGNIKDYRSKNGGK